MCILTILYGIEVYTVTRPLCIVKMITINNKLLRILQNSPYKFAVKELYLSFDTFAIPELHIHQSLILVHIFTP